MEPQKRKPRLTSTQRLNRKINKWKKNQKRLKNSQMVGKCELEIRGLPKSVEFMELKCYLFERLDLKVGTMRFPPAVDTGGPSQSSSWFWADFKTEEDREKALMVLNGFNWNGSILRCHKVSRTGSTSAAKSQKLRAKFGAPTNFKSQDEAMKYAHIPLWDIPYEEQLKAKGDTAKNLLNSFCRQMLDAAPTPELKEFYRKNKAKFIGLPCEFVGVIPSPSTVDCWQRCKFQIGLDENKDKTVGFLLHKYHKGPNIVAPVTTELVSLSRKVKEAVWMFERHMRHSLLDVFHPDTRKGHWRYLTVQTGWNTNDTVLIVNIHPKKLKHEKEECVKADLVDFYKNRAGKECQPTSIYVQLFGQKHFVISQPLVHLYGKKCLTEKICGITLDLNPELFFPQNVGALEVAHKWVRDLAGVDKITTVLDIYCGAGTYGLVLAQEAGEVFGLDPSNIVVNQARGNAKKNNFSNCQYFMGGTEALDKMRDRFTFNKIVAIVYPPRKGPVVGRPGLVPLREMENLNRVICLSHTPLDVMTDFWKELCCPTSSEADKRPFVPVKAVAIDALPHTNNYLLIFVFERLPAPLPQTSSETGS